MRGALVNNEFFKAIPVLLFCTRGFVRAKGSG